MRLATKSIDREKANRMLVELQQQTEMLTKKDVGQWRLAWQRAIDIENPNRVSLYDIYTDVDIDLHLTGCISQRKGMATKGTFKLTDKTGKEDKHVTELFQTEWFTYFVDYVLDSRYYGHSLIQFGSPINVPTSVRKFDRVELVPRRHVIPEYGVIVRNLNDVHQSGTSYRDGELQIGAVKPGVPKTLDYCSNAHHLH